MEKRLKEWVKETARDLIALGSIPFFILVLVRVYISAQSAYFNQFLIVGIVFIVLAILFKLNIASGLALIISFFLINHYQDLKFTIFTIIAYALLIFSLYYLKKSQKKIWLGILFGVVSIGISYAVNLIR